MQRRKNHPQGGIAIITLLVVSVFGMAVMTTLSVLAASESHMSSSDVASEKTFYAAEAGINEALYRLITHPVPQPFQFTINNVDVDVSVTPNPSNPYQRIITSQAEDTSGKIRIVRIIANTSSFAGGFDYAVQSGAGGLEILNNSAVIGDVYSNGNILGGTGAAIQVVIDGNVWVAGGDPVDLGPANSNTNGSDYNVAQVAARTDIAQSFVAPQDEALKTIKLYLRREGTLPANIYITIIKDDGSGNPSNGALLVSKEIQKNTIPTSFGWFEVTFATGPLVESGNTYWLLIDSPGVNASKYLIVKEDVDTAYTDGTAKISPDATGGTWTDISGDIAFETYYGLGDTYIEKVEINGDVHANTIDRCEIDNDAYYDTTIVNSTVYGAEFSGTPDPEKKPFPIQDVHIEDWKQDAEAGGITSGDVAITGSQVLGSQKIEGNLTINDGSHLTLNGILWVTGNVSFTKPNGSLSLATSFGPSSSVIIADGKIDINNNTTISGSGDPLSYIVLLSTHYSIDAGSPAINASNNSDAVLYYAKNGMVRVYNGSDLNGTSGYIIRLEEGSTVTYNPALASFTIPAGGGETIGTALGTWEEQ